MRQIFRRRGVRADFSDGDEEIEAFKLGARTGDEGRQAQHRRLGAPAVEVQAQGKAEILRRASEPSAAGQSDAQGLGIAEGRLIGAVEQLRSRQRPGGEVDRRGEPPTLALGARDGRILARRLDRRAQAGGGALAGKRQGRARAKRRNACGQPPKARQPARQRLGVPGRDDFILQHGIAQRVEPRDKVAFAQMAAQSLGQVGRRAGVVDFDDMNSVIALATAFKQGARPVLGGIFLRRRNGELAGVPAQFEQIARAREEFEMVDRRVEEIRRAAFQRAQRNLRWSQTVIIMIGTPAGAARRESAR